MSAVDMSHSINKKNKIPSLMVDQRETVSAVKV